MLVQADANALSTQSYHDVEEEKGPATLEGEASGGKACYEADKDDT